MVLWDYSRLITNMKRWSFKSKMLRAQEESLKLLPAKAQDPTVLRTLILPSEVETFAMLAIKEKEWTSKEIKDNEFKRAIETIRTYRHPKLFEKKGEEFGKWAVILVSATQFDFQFNPIYKINRYISYFDYVDDIINMPKEIKNKFGIHYREIVAPIILLWMHYSGDGFRLLPKQMEWLFKKYSKTIDLLTLTRDEYIKELDEITSKIEDYMYCHRPSYSWPFVMCENNRYMPTPHLLVRAVTESLFHRLTFGNNKLREKIGKCVLESYLYRLICKSDEFQEIIPEQEYQKGQKTLDVMASCDENIICFDSKSFVPQIGIRTFDPLAYKNTINRIVEIFIQAYKHIRYKFGVKYKYLSVPIKDDRSNIYAIVVLADNPFCPIDEIHLSAARELNIPIPSEEYDWLRGHVGIADVDAMEIQILQRKGFINAVTKNSCTKQYSDHWFTQGEIIEDDKKTEYMEDNVTNLVYTVIDAMKDDGVI